MAKFRLRKEDPEDDAVAPRVSADFFGTLRSEFDEPEVLPEGFVRLARHVQDAVIAYQDERIDRRELAERLSHLRAKDVTGAEWTIGSTSQRWYRRAQGGEWLPVPPPTQAIGEPSSGDWDTPAAYQDLTAEKPKSPEKTTYADEFDAGLDALLRDSAPQKDEEIVPPPVRTAPGTFQGPVPRVEDEASDEEVEDSPYGYAYPEPTTSNEPAQTIDDLLAGYQAPVQSERPNEDALDLTKDDVDPLAGYQVDFSTSEDLLGSYLEEPVKEGSHEKDAQPLEENPAKEDHEETSADDDVILDENLFWNGNDDH